VHTSLAGGILPGPQEAQIFQTNLQDSQLAIVPLQHTGVCLFVAAADYARRKLSPGRQCLLYFGLPRDASYGKNSANSCLAGTYFW